jgi:hypothetical protein
VITWQQLAHMIRAAASGLSRRGLEAGDTAGVFVDDAVSHTLAVHAVRAAGATAVAVRPARSASDIAGQLKQGRVRLLITSASLADLAVEAAERSWVRQVFAFGEAEDTTPFDSLLQSPRHGQHQAGESFNDAATSEQVFDVTELELGTDRVAPQLIRRPVPRLTCRDVVVAAPPCGDPEAYTSLLDVALAAGATVVAAPLSQVTAALGSYKGTAAIVPPGTQVPGLPAGRILAAG